MQEAQQEIDALKETYEKQIAELTEEIKAEKNFVIQIKDHDLNDARQSVRLSSNLNRSSRKLIIYDTEKNKVSETGENEASDAATATED